MEYNTKTNMVVIFSKRSKLETITKKIASLSGRQIYEFFSQRGVKTPRKLHLAALYSVLNNKLLELKSNSLSKESFLRLSYFEAFSETNLLLLADELFNDEDFLAYRMAIAKLFIINNVELNLNDGEVNYLLTIRKTPMEDFSNYSNYISSMCYEMENTFDGQDKDVFFDNLLLSTSVKSILLIGEKYGIPAPSRLNKEEFVHYLVASLKINNETKKQELNNMTVKELEAFASKNKLPMHMNMNKKDVITYFIFTINQFILPLTTLKRITIPDEFMPIKVSVDIEKVNIFGNGEPESVVSIYDEELEKQKLEEKIRIEQEKKQKEEEARLAFEEEILKQEELEKALEEKKALKKKELEEKLILEEKQKEEKANLEKVQIEELSLEDNNEIETIIEGNDSEEDIASIKEDKELINNTEEAFDTLTLKLESENAKSFEEKESKALDIIFSDEDSIEEKLPNKKNNTIVLKVFYGIIIIVLIAIIALILWIMLK